MFNPYYGNVYEEIQVLENDGVLLEPVDFDENYEMMYYNDRNAESIIRKLQLKIKKLKEENDILRSMQRKSTQQKSNFVLTQPSIQYSEDFKLDDIVERIKGPSESTTLNKNGKIIHIINPTQNNDANYPRMYYINFNNVFEMATEDQLKLIKRNNSQIQTNQVQYKKNIYHPLIADDEVIVKLKDGKIGFIDRVINSISPYQYLFVEQNTPRANTILIGENDIDGIYDNYPQTINQNNQIIGQGMLKIGQTVHSDMRNKNGIVTNINTDINGTQVTVNFEDGRTMNVDYDDLTQI
jgi:hypothetical protein